MKYIVGGTYKFLNFTSPSLIRLNGLKCKLIKFRNDGDAKVKILDWSESIRATQEVWCPVNFLERVKPKGKLIERKIL